MKHRTDIDFSVHKRNSEYTIYCRYPPRFIGDEGSQTVTDGDLCIITMSENDIRNLIEVLIRKCPPVSDSTLEPLYAVDEFAIDCEASYVISSYHDTEEEAVAAAAKVAEKNGDEINVFKRVASVRATKTYKIEVVR